MMHKQHESRTIILWLCAIFFVALNLRPAITSIGPLFNTILADLQVSHTQMSLLTSIPVFCMGLFAPLAIPFQRKFTTMKTILLLLVTIAVATLGRIFFASYAVLLATSFVIGFAIAIIGPLMNSYIKMRFPNRTATAMGVYTFGIGAGASLSASLSITIFDISDENWAFALGIWGVLAVVATIVWLISMREPIHTKEGFIPRAKARKPWHNKHAWLILLFFGLQTALFFTMMTWLSPIAIDKGFSVQQASLMLTVLSSVQMVGNLILPMLFDKFGTRMQWLIGLSLVVCIGMTGLVFGNERILWLSIVLIAIALSGLFPIGLLLPLDEAQNEREANEWSSMVLSGGFMLSAIIPLLVGILIDYTNNHAYTYMILLAMCATLVVLAITIRNKKIQVQK